MIMTDKIYNHPVLSATLPEWISQAFPLLLAFKNSKENNVISLVANIIPAPRFKSAASMPTCKGLRQDLMDCLLSSDCVKTHTLKECLAEDSSIPDECRKLQKFHRICIRGLVWIYVLLIDTFISSWTSAIALLASKATDAAQSHLIIHFQSKYFKLILVCMVIHFRLRAFLSSL